jgi:hypothetical protein
MPLLANLCFGPSMIECEKEWLRKNGHNKDGVKVKAADEVEIRDKAV